MENTANRTNRHMFSLELKSKSHLKSLTLSNEKGVNVVIEGCLGSLENLNLTEGVVLEINCAHGSLKMDVDEKDLKKLLSKQKLSPRETAEETPK